MEKINGISFEDWAAAAANIAHGMPFEEILKILEIEEPVWEDTNKQWGEKMADLMSSNMEVAVKYGEIFQNPKVGKFANAGSGSMPSLEDTLKLVPDYDTFVKISEHQSAGYAVGLDAGEIIESYGLSVGQWGQISSYWSGWVRENINEKEDPEAMAQLSAHEKWSAYFEDFYKDKKVDLGDDIDFDDDDDDDDVDPDWVPNDEDPFFADDDDDDDEDTDNDYNNSEIKALMREANALQNEPEKAVEVYKKAIALMEEANDEDYDYDNLYANYFVMKYYQQQTGDKEDKLATEYASNCLDLLMPTINAGNIWEYTEEGQFQMEVIRVASNTVAWNMMKRTDEMDKLEKALGIIDLGIDYINDSMPSEYYLYLYDTKVRILMKMNEIHTAYCWVYQVLEEEPNFADFDDIKNSSAYKEWLQSDEFKEFLTELEEENDDDDDDDWD
ncbi:MAG: hypothetical protein KGV44_06750 [Flavobacteriaceae bacterium]|nr:hypothetical protein [Flavobacteriaceae bacterium]